MHHDRLILVLYNKATVEVVLLYSQEDKQKEAKRVFGRVGQRISNYIPSFVYCTMTLLVR